MLDVTVIIPTYYPGVIIKNLFQSLPKVREIIILDNGSDVNLKSLITSEYNFINYINVGDIGLGKTFNYGLGISKSENIFITQPDVIIEKNCLENILQKQKKYTNAAILSPLVFEKEKYAFYDAPLLKLDKSNFLINCKIKNTINKIPDGDLSVEAVTSTAILLKKNIIKELNGWDNFYYTYLEDIDLSARVRIAGYEIIKVKKSLVQHQPFSSHSNDKHDYINNKRILNFMRSSIYFQKKFSNKINFKKFFIKNFLKYFCKLLINILLLRIKKVKINYIKLKQFFSLYSLFVS